MVFRAKGSRTFKLRVEHADGRSATLSTGCILEKDADDVETIVRRWQGRKGKQYARQDVIDALVAKRIRLIEAYEASIAGTLEQLLGAHPATEPSVDLLPLIDAWHDDKAKARRGGGQASVYKDQVLTLFPQRPLTLAMFTRKEVWARIDALNVEAPTKNRYRSAASSLAKFLVKRELLERNFVRDIDGYGEHDPRLVYYEIDDAKRLIKALAQPYAGIAAFALAFCAEWAAIDQLRIGDIALTDDPVIAHVRGKKRSWRDRYVPLVPELAWALKYLKPLLVGKFQGALVFDGVPEWRAIDEQRAAAAMLKLVAIGEEHFGPHSIHDWRQTHAVALLRWGYNEQIAADHLGHKNTMLVRQNYGRFKPTKYDYAKAAVRETVRPSATKSATTSKKNLKRGGVSR